MQEDVEFWFATIGRRLTAALPYWRYIKLPIDHRTDRMVERLRATVQGLIEGARSRIDAQPALRSKPSDLAGLHVPKGTVLFLLPRPVAMDAQHFERPLEFDPRRWLSNGDTSADDARRKLIPFGGGQRLCPGRYLAMVEMRAVLAMVLRNFSFALDLEGRAVREHFTFTLGPSALPIRFALR